MIRAGLVICFMIIMSTAEAQESEWSTVQEDQAGVMEDTDLEGDLEQIEYLRNSKLSLNSVGSEELMMFPFISAYQAEQFILYRKLLGNFIDVMEMQAIPGWDEGTVRRILPFVTIVDYEMRKRQLLGVLERGVHQFTLRSSIKEGAGVLAKYQFKTPFFQGGIQFEKDAGEKIIQGKKGISFLSGQVSIAKLGAIRQFIVGDFTVNMAQGLLLGLGRAVRKSSMPLMIKKQHPFLMPYRSTDENRFFRGVGIGLSWKRWEAGAFYSVNKLDGNLKTDAVFGSYVSSLQTSGLHKTEAEIMDKNVLQLRSFGGMGSVSVGRIKLGIHGVKHVFSLPVIREDDLYNLYALRGKTAGGLGLKVESTLRNLHWFGEGSRDWAGHFAFLGGMQMAAHRLLDISILVRNISKQYRSFWANSFTEGTEPTDEKGLFMGISFKPMAAVQIDAYADRYRSDWLKYQTNSPITGFDQLILFQIKPDRQTIFYVRLKRESKEEGISDKSSIVQKTGEKKITGGRVHLERRLSEYWVWRNRVEWTNQISAEGVLSRGSLVYTEWFWKNMQKPFSFNARFMFCETDDYSARLYAYENDVMNYGLIPAFFGKYFRVYGNVNIDIGSKIAFQMKVSQNFPVVSNSLGIRFQFLWKG